MFKSCAVRIHVFLLEGFSLTQFVDGLLRFCAICYYRYQDFIYLMIKNRKSDYSISKHISLYWSALVDEPYCGDTVGVWMSLSYFLFHPLGGPGDSYC